MKKLFAIITLTLLASNIIAQEVFYTGYNIVEDTKVAMLYKNNEQLYSVQHDGFNCMPKTVSRDSDGNLYWMVNIYNGNSFRYTEVWKNDQLYVTTEGLSGVRIIDIYCLNDTLYYAGHYTNEDDITVATVWKGTDFTSHWQLGDGVHDSFIYDAEVNLHTRTPYFCGYVTEEKTKATVWERSQIKYSYDLDYVIESVAKEISIDNDSIFTLGYYTLDAGFATYSYPAAWRNGERTASFDVDVMVNCLCAHNGDFYYCWEYPHGLEYEICKNRTLTTVFRFPFDGSAGANRIKAFYNDLYVVGVNEYKGCIWKNFEVLIQPDNCKEVTDIFVFEEFPPKKSEWYYEIQNNDGSITYQHLECVGDTLFDREGKRPKVIVRSNTHYDRNEITEVTHEYVYEENGYVYWWNHELQEFTILYDLNAAVGDEWQIKVGMDSLTMHVDAVENYEYDDKTYRMLCVSDENDLFSGNIVCGIGHLTSFFPEKLMCRDKNYRIKGLRCYWIEGNLVFKTNRDDCDAIYAEWHNGVEEPTDNAVFAVYPNPANGILLVETCHGASLPIQTYRIANLMGQTLLQGKINADTQRINIENLSAGLYFITIGDVTQKFEVKQ